MKGVKTMSLANGTSEKFHADKLVSSNVVIKESLMIQDLNVVEVLKQLQAENEKLMDELRQLKEKVDTFEVSD